MAAVRAYCLAEHQRLWGKPWDGSWVATKEHILALQKSARRGQQIWENLRAAVEEAIDFVGDQGLHVLEEAKLLKVVGTVPFEAIVIHGWLHRYWPAITSLLEAEDFDPILSIRSELASGLELERIEEPSAPGAVRWHHRERPLKDKEMAIISLLIGNEPSKIRAKLREEALTVEDVITMEREAINTALHRHGESKRVAKERRALVSTTSGEPGEGRAASASSEKRRVKAKRRT